MIPTSLSLCLAVALMTTTDARPAAAETDKIVRTSVYENDPAIGSPEGDFHTVLLIPQPLEEAYKKHPREVLDVLLRIADGGSPDDASLAAGFAMSFVHTPGVGVVVVQNYNKAAYDTVDKDWAETPREHWLRKIKEKMNADRLAK